jgi:hypothetical protein
MVDIKPNSLLREINKLRSRYHAPRLANIKYSEIVVNFGIRVDIMPLSWQTLNIAR